MFSEKKKEIQDEIFELEQSIASLKEKLAAIEHQEQHEMLEDVESYMNAVDTRSSSLKQFWYALKEELKGK